MIEIDEIISSAEYCADVYERMNKAIHPALQVSDYKRHAEDHKQLAEWLKELKQLREQTRWITVSERLPEYMDTVLTWDGGAFCIEKRIPYILDADGEPVKSDWWVGDEYDADESDYYPNLRDGAPIAWMPLPKPYEP